MAGQRDTYSAVDAADRAGSIVADHVRSIIDAATARAEDIEREAEREAEELRTRALEAANNVLRQIDSIEGSLGSLVSDLRTQTDNLGSPPSRSED